MARLSAKDKASIWRSRIHFLSGKRRAFFEGSTSPTVDQDVIRRGPPGADFAIAAFRGDTRPKWWNESDPWVCINKVKSSIRANLPSLLYSNPEFKVYPAAHDMENGVDVAYDRARAKELWLNHIYTEANGNCHVRNAIQNSFVALGVIKAGYRCHFQDDDKRGVFERDDAGNYVLDEAGDPKLSRGSYLKDEHGEVMRDEDGIPIPHPGKLTKEHWWIESIDPKLMLFDVESGHDYFQHRFVIEEWVRPLEEVKADPRFPRARRERLKATESVRGESTQRKSIFSQQTMSASGSLSSEAVIQNDEARVRGWDIYDFVEQRYLVLPDAGDEEDEFLLDADMPAGMDHGPYRFLKLTEDMGTEWYPIPDAIDMALVNQEYNITRSEMMIHREHTKSRYLELPGAFEGDGSDADEERAKFAHAPDGALVKVSGANVILPAPKANLDGSFMQAVPNIAADFNEVAGLPGEARGIADAGTATQASILATGADIRNNDRRDNLVQTFLCQIGKMLLMSGQANAELDTLVIEKVVDATGVTPFRAVRLSPDELKGDFEVTISVGSTMPKNDPRAIQNLMTFLGMVSQNPIIGQASGLMRRILDAMGLDPILADELKDMAEQWRASQASPPAQGQTPMQGNTGQVLQNLLMGQANHAAGAPTGAPLNQGYSQ